MYCLRRCRIRQEISTPDSRSFGARFAEAPREGLSFFAEYRVPSQEDDEAHCLRRDDRDRLPRGRAQPGPHRCSSPATHTHLVGAGTPGLGSLVSAFVLDEISPGDSTAARDRLVLLQLDGASKCRRVRG